MSETIKKFVEAIDKFGIKKASYKSGVPYTTILNWRNGISSPSLENAERVARAINYEIKITPKETKK